MRSPTLAELPPPPPGKTGWPWTIESPQLPEKMSDGSPWPRISIVTPSYNQGEFIEETIRSVLLQGYPDLEYIIMDGASNDKSVSVIKKYASWLSSWASEVDRGQSHAINKGFEIAQGDWGNWINSDDVLLPGALEEVARAICGSPEGTDAVCLQCRLVNEDRSVVLGRWILVPVRSVRQFLNGGLQPMAQPATFRRLLHFRVCEDLHYVMDWASYLTLIEKNNDAFFFSDTEIVDFRLHDQSKTVSKGTNDFIKEEIMFLKKYKFKNFKDKFFSKLWIRRQESRTSISISFSFVDFFKIFLSTPEVVFDRMFLGRIRIILQKYFK